MHKVGNSKIKLKEFEQRKKDHISLSLDQKTQGLASDGFSKIQLIPQALPQFNFSETNISTELLGHSFLSPHFVSSMTAGHEWGQKINLALAQAAANNQWLMAVGSQRKELIDLDGPSEWDFILNKVPEVRIVSNIGIEEVNQIEVSKILRLVEKTNAVGLYVHLNSLQEVFQKNEALFKGSEKALRKLIEKSKIPILIKEVGFGISPELVEKLFQWGAQVVDLSGRGGTHWIRLEELRTSSSIYLSGFENWGLTNVDILKSLKLKTLRKNVWASGGIRHGVDSLKCLALGAKAVGVAQPLMKSAVGPKNKIDKTWNVEKAFHQLDLTMKKFDQELKIGLFGLGFKNLEGLQQSIHRKKKVWYEYSNG